MANWTYMDLGFDTVKLMWILQLHNSKGEGISQMMGKQIELRNTTTFQYEWPDNNLESKKDFWHIRQRTLSENVSKITMDSNDNIIVEGISKKEAISEQPIVIDDGAVALHMAYSLVNSKGFIELIDTDGKVIKTLKDKWLITENLTQKTIGTYPYIRLRSEKEDVYGMIVTGTTCVILGKSKN
jgi:hypothetical protein